MKFYVSLIILDERSIQIKNLTNLNVNFVNKINTNAF